MVYEQLAAQAGVELEPRETWLLLRLHDGDAAGLELDPDELAPLLDGLRRAGLAERERPALTAAGEDAAARIRQAGRDRVQALLAEWEPEQHPDILQLIQRFARTLTAAPPDGRRGSPRRRTSTRAGPTRRSSSPRACRTATRAPAARRR